MLENPIQSVPAAEVAGKTLIEEFMAQCYEFRRNVLSDKYEVREVCNESEADAKPKLWRAVTRESQNTLIRRTKRELGDLKGLKASIDEYIHSVVITCFRRPEAEEVVIPLQTRDIVYILCKNFPEIKPTQGMNVKVGRLLTALNFERKEINKGTVYYIVPMKKIA